MEEVDPTRSGECLFRCVESVCVWLWQVFGVAGSVAHLFRTDLAWLNPAIHFCHSSQRTFWRSSLKARRPMTFLAS